MPYIPNEADAGFADQAEPDAVDFDIINKGYSRVGVIEGCAVTAQGAPDMTLAVAVGVVEVDEKRVAVTSGNVTIGTAHATNPRFDLVHIDDTGAKGVTPGTAAANPVFPAHPANKVILAAVYVPATDTAIATNQIVDKRIMITRFDTFGFPLVTGKWYTGQIGQSDISASGATIVENRLYFMPFWSPRRRTYDEIGVYVHTGAGGAFEARLGIYDSTVNGEPNSLVLDGGAFSVATNGAKSVAISQELIGYRLYWLAMVSDGAPVTRGLNVPEAGSPYIGRNDLGASARAVRQIYGTHTFAALPATAPALTYDNGLVQTPAVMIKAA